MMIALFFLFAALSSPAFAAATDLSKIPTQFCQPALAVASETPSCEANGTFVRAASACYDSLNALEASIGAQAIALAQTGGAGQKAKNATGQALRYLRSVAEIAKRETEDYLALVATPPVELEQGAELPPDQPEIWAYEVPCFGEVHARLGEVGEAFSRKIARYDARLAEAKAHEKKLSGQGTNYGSVGAGAVTGKAGAGTPAPVPSGHNAPKSSDITGLRPKKTK